MPIINRIAEFHTDMTEWRRDLHAHPELSMQETRSAAVAADRLRAAGYEVTTGIGKTGVVGLPYASKLTMEDREGARVPVGHMCGHDMHVTWLAGASALLAQARGTWRGTAMRERRRTSSPMQP